MSAYGTIERAFAPVNAAPLVPRSYALPAPPASATGPPRQRQAMTVFPVTRQTCPIPAIEYLASVFNDVVEEGRTYPQLGVQTFEQFAAYFFAGDCFIGLLDTLTPEVEAAASTLEQGVDRGLDYDLARVKGDREWSDAVLGFYYVKPNYPGRASHNCNGGFVVPPRHRGLKVGLTLGRSYLHFAPKLGFRGSVFNLVFVNNIGSLKIWDQLGFSRAGLIPKAGLLKVVDRRGQNQNQPRESQQEQQQEEEEEYVDAVVYHYDFTSTTTASNVK